MTDNATRQFREILEKALDEYHPGWDVRRRATWHPEYDEIWQQNRRFQVWVDTLKRWVRGENFPRVKKFQGFLEKTNFPPELREELLTFYHGARQARRRQKQENEELNVAKSDVIVKSNIDDAIPRILGQRPLSPAQYFVGRTILRQRLRDWLGEDNVRIITLVGRSGIGKTALACHTLVELENNAQDHEIDAFVYLSTPLTSINLDILFQEIFHIFDESTQNHLQNIWASNLPHSEKITEWVASLEAYTVYILLDNLEDILDASGNFTESGLAEFIQKAVGNTDSIYFVLTTQLEPHLPNNLRHLHQILLIEEGLNATEGIQLLRDLDPNGHCGLRDAPLALLESAVERVHGIPRALQVLVGILEDDPLSRLEDILSQFEQFDDVRQIITHTLARLEEPALWVLRGLAILQQPSSLEILTFLLEPFAADVKIQDELKRLLRMRLVKIDRTNGLIALHPIDASAVYQNIEQEGLQTQLEHRAADYYAQFNTRQRYAYDDFLPHLYAFGHYIHANAHSQAYALIGEDGFQTLLELGYAQRVVELRKQVRGYLDSPQTEIINDYGYAQALQRVGDAIEAIHIYKQILRYPEIVPIYEKSSLVSLGELYQQRYDFEASLDSYQQSLAILPDTLTEVSEIAENKARLGLSKIYHQSGEHELALEHTQHALTLAENADNPVLMGNCLELLAGIYRNLAHHTTALIHNEDALSIARDTHDPAAEIYRLRQQSYLAIDMGDFTEALQALNAAMKIAVDKSNLYAQIYCLLGLSEVLLYQGDYQWALNCSKAALETAERVDNQVLVSSSCVYLVMGSLLLGDDDQAQNYFAQIQEIPQPILLLYVQVALFSDKHMTLQEALSALAEGHLPLNHYQALVSYGLRNLGENTLQSQQYFNQTLVEIDDILVRVPNLWQAHYAKGLAWAGIAMTTTDNTQITALTHAQDAYQVAYQSCNEIGVVAWGRKLIERLRPFDSTESLEPLRRILAAD